MVFKLITIALFTYFFCGHLYLAIIELDLSFCILFYP